MTALRVMVICATVAIATGCSDSTDAELPATQLAFTTQPASDTIDAPLAPVAVTARDAAGDVTTEFTGTITVALGDNPGNASLSGTLDVNAVAGVATFSNLSIDAAEDGYTLTATSGTLTPATSAVFDMSEVVTTIAMQYEADVLDLETGAVRACSGSPPCALEADEDLVDGRAFSGVHLADTAGAGFTTELVGDPFDDAHTVLIRTAAGNVFKLGNAVDLTASGNVRFQFARLN